MFLYGTWHLMVAVHYCIVNTIRKLALNSDFCQHTEDASPPFVYTDFHNHTECEISLFFILNKEFNTIYVSDHV